MNRNKAIICTIIFAVVIIAIAIAMLFIKPYNIETSLFHMFCPIIVGQWCGERIRKFYNWLRKND